MVGMPCLVSCSSISCLLRLRSVRRLLPAGYAAFAMVVQLFSITLQLENGLEKLIHCKVLTIPG